MGLSLEVGILADLQENDSEGESVYRQYFATLNDYLATVGLEPHVEPHSCDVWSADMFGYSGLHYLRRLAAHVDLTGMLPSPGDEDSSRDPVLDGYFANFDGKRSGLISRLFARRQTFGRKFDHLIVHSDAEGFYLPADFPNVLIVPPEYPITGGIVGSAPRLFEELSRLSKLLEIPDTLDSQSDALWEAADTQGTGKTLWQRFGIESFSCVVLREGCRNCIATGAALVFT